MVQLVYFSGDSGNTHRFVQSLGIEAMRIGDAEHRTPICLTEPFVLLTPTYGGGADYAAIPRPVRQFLARADNRARLRGVIGAGHRNFGFAFCLASRLLADQYSVPELYRLDGVGTDQDRERILTALTRVLGMAPASAPTTSPALAPAELLSPARVSVPAPQVAPPSPLRRSRIRTGAQPIVGETAPTAVASVATATATATATPAATTATAPTMPVVETTAAAPASAPPRSTPASAVPPSRGADAGAPAAPVTRSGRRAARLATATDSGASQPVNVNVPVDPPAARTPSVPSVTIEGNRSEPAASRGHLSPPPVIAGTIVNPVPTLTTVSEPMRTRSRPAAVPVASATPLTQVTQQSPVAPLAPTIPVREPLAPTIPDREPVARVADPSPMVPRRARRLAVAEDSGIPSPGPAPTRRSLRQDRG